MADISRRKDDHLELAMRGDVAFKQTTSLFECVRLIHNALPELCFEEIDASSTLFGKRLRAPLLIAGMTGGSSRARDINRELASIAERLGYVFGLGSQRAMLKDRALLASYQVRDVAPNVLLLGNIGIVQARHSSVSELEDLVALVGADALCVHLNPAMELIQADGDRDFRGGLDTLARLVNELRVPVIVKETGCGVSHDVAQRLRSVGVCHLDVSAAGGTSWVAVETQRASDERRGLGETFWEWGIPTAASLVQVAPLGFQTLFATGGVQSGLDVAKSIALGASAAGIARRALQALDQGGVAGASAFLERVETELRMAMLLCGAKSLAALRRAPRVISGELRHWLDVSGTTAAP